MPASARAFRSIHTDEGEGGRGAEGGGGEVLWLTNYLFDYPRFLVIYLLVFFVVFKIEVVDESLIGIENTFCLRVCELIYLHQKRKERKERKEKKR